ncbi:hypothetical protein HOG47_03035 [archaeon]|jgi:hypothetical protein|nr:hypothetical protein [archaeon]
MVLNLTIEKYLNILNKRNVNDFEKKILELKIINEPGMVEKEIIDRINNMHLSMIDITNNYGISTDIDKTFKDKWFDIYNDEWCSSLKEKGEIIKSYEKVIGSAMPENVREMVIMDMPKTLQFLKPFTGKEVLTALRRTEDYDSNNTILRMCGKKILEEIKYKLPDYLIDIDLIEDFIDNDLVGYLIFNNTKKITRSRILNAAMLKNNISMELKYKIFNSSRGDNYIFDIPNNFDLNRIDKLIYAEKQLKNIYFHTWENYLHKDMSEEEIELAINTVISAYHWSNNGFNFLNKIYKATDHKINLDKYEDLDITELRRFYNNHNKPDCFKLTENLEIKLSLWKTLQGRNYDFITKVVEDKQGNDNKKLFDALKSIPIDNGLWKLIVENHYIYGDQDIMNKYFEDNQAITDKVIYQCYKNNIQHSKLDSQVPSKDFLLDLPYYTDIKKEWKTLEVAQHFLKRNYINNEDIKNIFTDYSFEELDITNDNIFTDTNRMEILKNGSPEINKNAKKIIDKLSNYRFDEIGDMEHLDDNTLLYFVKKISLDTYSMIMQETNNIETIHLLYKTIDDKEIKNYSIEQINNLLEKGLEVSYVSENILKYIKGEDLRDEVFKSLIEKDCFNIGLIKQPTPKQQLAAVKECKTIIHCIFDNRDLTVEDFVNGKIDYETALERIEYD